MKNWPFIAAGAVGAAWLFAVVPARAGKSRRKQLSVKYFAHRGLHTGDSKVPENSLAALKLASDEGFGAELDVNLDGDGNVVVFHDDGLRRMTGKDGRLNDTGAAELSKLDLLGSGEKIPLFSEVLESVGKMPLIVELKTTQKYRELCEKTLRLIRAYPGDAVIESFDPRIVAWFRKNAPDVTRGQLTMKGSGKDIKNPIKRFALNNLLGNIIARPHFIAVEKSRSNFITVRLCRMLGAAIVVWTTRTPEETIAALDSNGIIFEHHDPHKL